MTQRVPDETWHVPLSVQTQTLGGAYDGLCAIGLRQQHRIPIAGSYQFRSYWTTRCQQRSAQC
jgi:hypothetical protein